MSNSNGLHTTDAEHEMPISYEESISIAGVAPDETEEELVPSDQLLETNTRRIENSPLPRSVLVFGTLGVLFLGWVAISNFGRKPPQIAKTEDTKKEIAVEPNESDAFRSQLALVDQQYDSNQTQTTKEKVPPEKAPAKEPTVIPVSTAPPPSARPTSPPRPAPAAPLANRSTPSSIAEVPTSIVQPSEPEVDPFEQWTKLAVAGTSGTDLAVIERTQLTANRNAASRARAANDSASFAIATIGDAPLVTEPRATFTRWSTTKALRQPVYISPSDTEPKPKPEPVSGEPANSQSNLLQALRENEEQRADSLEPEQSFEAETQIENSAIAPARPREAADSEENDESGDVEPKIAQDSQLSAGARRILDRASSTARDYLEAQPQAHQITTGTWAAATVVVPMVYSPDSSSDNPSTPERFAVALTEPLLDINGTPALPEGTVLITETEFVSVQSRVINQAVVAIIYADRNGNMQQDMLERGVLSIRGKNNAPLIAQLSNEQNTTRQDLMFGLSNALSNIGRTINSGSTTSTSASSPNSASSTTIFSNGDRNILAAALEGFFGATTERMQQRLEPDDERLPVLVVPEGEEVSVFVNGLLNVNR